MQRCLAMSDGGKALELASPLQVEHRVQTKNFGVGRKIRLSSAIVIPCVNWSRLVVESCSAPAAAEERGGVPARQRARGRDAAYLNHYFGAGAPGGGTIFITNDVGFSVGPNGPGTLFFTAGMLLR